MEIGNNTFTSGSPIFNPIKIALHSNTASVQKLKGNEHYNQYYANRKRKVHIYCVAVARKTKMCSISYIYRKWSQNHNWPVVASIIYINYYIIILIPTPHPIAN